LGVVNVRGTLRVLRDVNVRRGPDDEFIAISRERAVAGELLTLDRVVDGTTISALVNVVDCRPVIVEGSVRHRLRLRLENLNQRRPTA
jgi:hypothetical protein